MADPIHAADVLRRTALADVRVYPRLASTNTRAEKLLRAGSLKLPAGVIASRQTAGRGQHHRRWFADGGSLAVTFVMTQPHTPASQLPLRVGLAVRQVVAALVHPRHAVTVKWPNDVLIDGRKVAGILCQSLHHAAIIGIGINVSTNLNLAPPGVLPAAVALADLRHQPLARQDVLVALWPALSEATTFPAWRDNFQKHHHFKDQRVIVDADPGPISGLCRGVDDHGRLLIQTDSAGTQSLVTGRIRMPSATVGEIF